MQEKDVHPLATRTGSRDSVPAGMEGPVETATGTIITAVPVAGRTEDINFILVA